MQSHARDRFTGVLAGLVGISYVVVGAAFFLAPEEQRGGAFNPAALRSVVQDGAIEQQVQFWALGFGALLAIAVVYAVADIVRPAGAVVVRWATTIAVIGFAVVSIQTLLLQDQVPNLANRFDRLDGETHGLGLALIENRAGEVTVHPFPRSSPPEGVGDGDVLVAVDGEATSVEEAVAMVANAGETVTLTLRTGQEAPRDVTVTKGSHRFLELSTREALLLIGPTDIDPDSWLGFGTVGVWFLIVNWLALRRKLFPTLLPYFGLAGGVAYLLVLADSVLELGGTTVLSVAAGAAIVIGPVWFIWIGVFLWRGTVDTPEAVSKN